MEAKRGNRHLFFEASRPDITIRLRDLIKVPDGACIVIPSEARNLSLFAQSRVADKVLVI
jgi:hypothetical protein